MILLNPQNLRCERLHQVPADRCYRVNGRNLLSGGMLSQTRGDHDKPRSRGRRA
jgi:hypothetical protein